MRIYTRTGDDGTTQLLGPGRVAKDADRVEAYGTVDELNAGLGVALAQALPPVLAAELRRVQDDLFTVGAELATPAGVTAPNLPRVPAAWVSRLEGWIDQHEANLPPLSAFILPGGSPGAAALHLARCVCRRAERAVVHLDHREPVPPALLQYLNRLSDYLFVVARVANQAAGVADSPWTAPPPLSDE